MTAPACPDCGEYNPLTYYKCSTCGRMIKLRPVDKSNEVESNTEKETPS